MNVDERSFRKALGCFASGVTVVTALDAGRRPVGVTVSAFCSVSLAPPLVLACLGERTADLDAYTGGGHFAVNILSDRQRDLSIRFASRSDDKWAGVEWAAWDSGVPILAGCLANLECRTVEARPLGDHVVLVGEVVRLHHDQGGAPLLYCRGTYMTAQ
jgi:flavin reductase (DIM6/NTAB) family NADH-FMN oxidoreductase RutF